MTSIIENFVVFLVRVTILVGYISDAVFAPPKNELKELVYKALIGKGSLKPELVRARIKNKASIGLVMAILKELVEEGYVERKVIVLVGTDQVNVVYHLTTKQRPF
jgi:hypothetical protein